MKKIFIGLMTGAIASPLLAGWISGGGELFKEKGNPWFVQNTEHVKYCIESDAAHFQMGEDRLDQLIQYGFAFWKRELSHGRDHLAKIKVATQDFARVACNQYHDIAFQFGILHENQLTDFKQDFRNFIGVTVLQNYDTVNLKGRGYIYFSPDEGDKMFKHNNPPEKAWHTDRNVRLFYAILHEQQHIFGISHSNQSMLLEEGFLENYLDNTLGPIVLLSELEMANLDLSIFSPSFRKVYTGFAYNFGFFGVENPANDNDPIYFRFKFDNSEKLSPVYNDWLDPFHDACQWTISVEIKTEKNSDWEKIGYFEVNGTARGVGSTTPMRVFFPSDQKAFYNLDPKHALYDHRITLTAEYNFPVKFIGKLGITNVGLISLNNNKMIFNGVLSNGEDRNIDRIFESVSTGDRIYLEAGEVQQ